ncbi:hypothetical protein NE237_009873 [Protea cynaroides]|uniref:Short-chain dehydrogenase/reductase n=1 Tax=Protea cynaroides TaxID=273540 RepID=A0A9Q0R0P9_9MAGN|nr:hypothetical protein NE237_009873 [Protea cynaroides]
MADTITNSTSKRLAVVTGANKGIGFEICRQLASNGIAVVLTARDEKRGIEAVEKLNRSGLSDVVFHQMDVKDPASIASLAHFINTQFGKLDILVNNAGITGVKLNDNDYDALMAVDSQARVAKLVELARLSTRETAEECIQVNYYGTKRVTEALLPILQLSHSPRIVNVSSTFGKLQYVSVELAKEVLGDVDALTKEKVDVVLKEYLNNFKENQGSSAYSMSKAAVNAYTRIVAKRFPTFRINCVCPGYVKTDINLNTGHCTVEEGAAGPVKLALLFDDGPSGLFFFQEEVSTFD